MVVLVEYNKVLLKQGVVEYNKVVPGLDLLLNRTPCLAALKSGRPDIGHCSPVSVFRRHESGNLKLGYWAN